MSAIIYLIILLSPILVGIVLRANQNQVSPDNVFIPTAIDLDRNWISSVLFMIKIIYENPYFYFLHLLICRIILTPLHKLTGKIRIQVSLAFMTRKWRIVLILFIIPSICLLKLYFPSYTINCEKASYYVPRSLESKSKLPFQEYGLIKRVTQEIFLYMSSYDYDILLVTNNTVFFAIDKLYVFDISDITSPKEIAVLDHQFKRLAATKDGAYLIGIKNSGFSIFDISNKKSEIKEIASNYTFQTVLFNLLLSNSNNALYLISSNVYVFNITDIYNASLHSYIPFSYNNTAAIMNKAGTILYVTGYDFNTITLTSEFNLTLTYTKSKFLGGEDGITDIILISSENRMFVRSVWQEPELNFNIVGLSEFNNLSDPTWRTVAINLFDTVRIFHHGLYYSKVNDLVYYVGGYEGIGSLLGFSGATFEYFGTRETFGLQIPEDESYMVVLDGTYLKTVKNIITLKAEPLGDYKEKFVSFVPSTIKPAKIYIGPSEKYIFFFNKLSDDGVTYEIIVAKIESPTLITFLNNTMMTAESIIEDLTRENCFIFLRPDGFYNYDIEANIFTNIRESFDARHLTRFSDSDFMFFIFYGFLVVFDQDLNLIGFGNFGFDSGGEFLLFSREIIFYIKDTTLYKMQIRYTEGRYERILLISTVTLRSTYTEYHIGTFDNFFYFKNEQGVDVYIISGDELTLVGSYINPASDSTIVVDEVYDKMYFYTNYILHTINISNKSQMAETYSLTLPHTVLRMWYYFEKRYLYIMTPSEIVTINVEPWETASIDQKVFKLGFQSSHVITLFQMSYYYNSENSHTKGLDPNEYAPTDVKLYDYSYSKGDSYETFYDLPDWIYLNIPSREISFAPDTKQTIGDYYLYISFSKRISSSNFDDLIGDDSSFSSQDVFSELIKLGYLTLNGMLTSKFHNKKIQDLPTRMSSFSEKITAILSWNFFFTKYKISVVKSLSIDLSSPPDIRIQALDTIQLNIHITLTNGLFSPNLNFAKVFVQLSSDRSMITLKGLRDPMLASIALLSINILNENVIALMIVDDYLNPTISEEIPNITQYIKVNNRPILNQNPTDFKVIPIRQSSIEIPANLFIDTNDQGNTISYDIFLISNNTNEIDPLPSFLAFDKTRTTLYADPSLSDAFFNPENNTYQRDYALMILALSTTGLSSSYNFTLRVKNEPPYNYLPISYQILGFKFYTGVSFSIALEHDTFIDFDGDNIDYFLENEEENTKVPGWIAFKDFTLTGEPPQELFGTYKFSLVASDGISKTRSSFTIRPSISFNYFLTLIYVYIGIILGISAIVNKAVTIHKIFFVNTYRYPHTVIVRSGDILSYQDLPPIAIISDLEERIKAIKTSINKSKMIKPTDGISSYDEKIEALISWTTRVLNFPKLSTGKKKILHSIIFYHLIQQKINLKQNKNLKKIFKGLKAVWKEIVNTVLEKDEGGFKRSLPSFEIHNQNYKYHMKDHILDKDQDELLRHALLGYAFNNHVLIYNQAKIFFKLYEKREPNIFYRLLRLPKDSLLEISDYRFKPLFKDEILTFDGKLARDFTCDYAYFRIVRSQWILGLFRDFIIKEIVFKVEKHKNYSLYAKV